MKSKYTTRTKVLIGLEILTLLFLFFSFYLLPENAFVYGILIILLLYNLRSKTEIVSIDKDGIVVNNWLTTEKRKYNFDQFDKVVKYIDPIETLGRLNLYLLSDNVIFCKIKGRNYMNLDDLIMEIERLKRKRQS